MIIPIFVGILGLCCYSKRLLLFENVMFGVCCHLLLFLALLLFPVSLLLVTITLFCRISKCRQWAVGLCLTLLFFISFPLVLLLLLLLPLVSLLLFNFTEIEDGGDGHLIRGQRALSGCDV